MRRLSPPGSLVLALMLALMLALGACRSQETPSATPTGIVPPGAGVTSSPAVEPTTPVLYSTATPAEGEQPYPGPDEPTVTGEAYPFPIDTPYPGVIQPTSTTEGSYPLPEEFPTVTSAYPGSGFTPTPVPTLDAYPGPGSTPVQSPQASPTSVFSASPTPSPTNNPGFQTPVATVISTRTPTQVPSPTFTPSPTPYSGTPGPTPDSTLLATDPDTVRLASGKVQLIEFFAFWCTNCRMMAPVMNALQAEYGSQINFIYLDIDDPDVKPFKDALHFTIPRWGVEPNFFLVDEKGKVVKAWIGLVDAASFRQFMDTALR